MDFESFVLAASTGDLTDATDPRTIDNADAVEYRLDLATAPLAALDRYEGEPPIIATNRPTWEGGQAEPGEDRLDTLLAAAKHDFVQAIDIELEAVRRGDAQRVLEQLGPETAIIVSVHDFDRTPPEGDCQALVEAALEYGDVAKLAVTAQDPADVLVVLSVTRTYAARGQRVAAMAMGEHGRHSRAVAPIYGSRIGYAPVDPADATAPGQYDVATLRSLVEELKAR